MQRIRRILVAVKDTRKKRNPAIAKAATLARATGARLELFHAICEPVAFESLTGGALQKLQDDEVARHARRLDAIAAPLRRAGIEVGTSVEWDYPSYEAIVRRAGRIKADLIVARRHASAHSARWLLRYADWELLRQSPVPLLLVANDRPWRKARILAAVDPAHAFAKTAQLDRAILELGSRMSEASDGELHVLHAYVPSISDVSSSDLKARNATQRIADAAAAHAAQRLDKALRGAGIAADQAEPHLVPLHPADSIPGLARRLRANVVVMGAMSRSGLKGLFIGNTAERVLDALRCDVLIVKPPGFVSRVPDKVRGPELFFAVPPSGLT